MLLYFEGEQEVQVLSYSKGEPEVHVLFSLKGDDEEVQGLLYFKGERGSPGAPLF